MEQYFSGEKLYGDDFSIQQIEEWFREEEEAFANLYGVNTLSDSYSYHNLNYMYGYKYLRDIPEFERALGFGASWGYEFFPIIDRIKNLFILEASSQTVSSKLGELTPVYKKPNVNGAIDYPDNHFDLITCFDTLHHIPNVSYVMSELFRVLAPGGFWLLREPIHSMGDWRNERNGLTKNERGIPIDYLNQIIQNSGMKVVHQNYYNCMTAFLGRTFNAPKFFISKPYLYLDKFLARLFKFNIHYHAVNKFQRITPNSVFFVITKS